MSEVDWRLWFQDGEWVYDDLGQRLPFWVERALGSLCVLMDAIALPPQSEWAPPSRPRPNHRSDPEFRATFGARLTERLKQEPLTRKEWAHVLGVSQASLTDWANGRRIPTLARAVDVAGALGVRLAWLVGEES